MCNLLYVNAAAQLHRLARAALKGAAIESDTLPTPTQSIVDNNRIGAKDGALFSPYGFFSFAVDATRSSHLLQHSHRH